MSMQRLIEKLSAREADTCAILSADIEGYDPISVQVDVRGRDQPTVFAMSVRKSGSSLFANLVNAISGSAHRTVVDIPAEAFKLNIPYRVWCQSEHLSKLVWPGNVYTGFRDAPKAIYGDPVFIRARKMLLVRDPRDLLVSEFFSNAYSHSLPGKDAQNSVIAREREVARRSDVESYVLARAESINQTIRGYRALLTDPNVSVMRYEDVIFKKTDWLRTIAEILDIKISDQLIENIMGWADVVPSKEVPTEFVRRVTPGDHLDKLSPAAITKLDAALDATWWELGYRKHDATTGAVQAN